MLMMVIDTLDAEDKSKAEQLITRYQGLLYSIAYKMIGNEHMAEDIVIEAWIKILSHLDSIGEVEENRTKGFLVTILENTAINEYNKNKKKLQREVVIEETSSYFAWRFFRWSSTRSTEAWMDRWLEFPFYRTK